MVIEYSGMLVRSVLTDKREKYYESKVRHLEFNNVTNSYVLNVLEQFHFNVPGSVLNHIFESQRLIYEPKTD